MSYLVPKSFWSLPGMELPSMIDDADWGYLSNSPSGLSLSEDDKHVYAEAAVPGVNPEDIDVTYEKGLVKISGATKHEEKEGRKVWKRSQSEFSYQFSVPTDVDLSGEPVAQIKHGVLHLTFEKSAKVQPKKITVKAA